MINAELKFCIILVFASLIVSLVALRIYFSGKTFKFPKFFIWGISIFSLGILTSNLFAHNETRAWISSILWHFLPLALCICLAQFQWTRIRIIIFTSFLILSGLVTSIICLDQHYLWTDWSIKLPMKSKSIPTGIIFNHNFAAEFLAPILPVCLGLAWYTRNLLIRIILLFSLAFIFLPVLSLSLARGAWVGMIAGCALASFAFLIANLAKGKITREILPKVFPKFLAFIILALALPAYLYTSNYWKKSSEESIKHSKSLEIKELASISIQTEDSSILRRYELWKDAWNSIWEEDFLFGKGTDHYELHFHETAENSDAGGRKSLVRYVHNDYLQTLYENGLVGFFGLSLIWFGILYHSLKRFNGNENDENNRLSWLRLGLIAGFATFLIESFFEFPGRSPCALLVAWSILGLLLGLTLQANLETNPLKSTTKYIGPFGKLIIGSLGLFAMPASLVLSKNIFWGNVYHYQARRATDVRDFDKSLEFHRKSIEFTPWQDRSRKWESYLLLSKFKNYKDALSAAEKAIEVHPGCLNAHRYRIGILYNQLNRREDAKLAFEEMKRIAPYHIYTRKEERRFKK